MIESFLWALTLTAQTSAFVIVALIFPLAMAVPTLRSIFLLKKVWITVPAVVWLVIFSMAGIRLVTAPDPVAPQKHIAKPNKEYETVDACVVAWNHYYDITGNKKIDEQDQYAIFQNCQQYISKYVPPDSTEVHV